MHVCFIFQKMSSINLLLIILVKNELIGENYLDWKRNLFNILTAKDCKYVLTQQCPPKPSLYIIEIRGSLMRNGAKLTKWLSAIYWLRFLWNCRTNFGAWKQPLKYWLVSIRCLGRILFCQRSSVKTCH